MIWNGKRYEGVHVYVGRQNGECPGEYVVVYKCNGANHSYGEVHWDAYVGMMYGQKFPNTMSSIHAAYLERNYREVSQRKIPAEDQEILAPHIIES